MQQISHEKSPYRVRVLIFVMSYAENRKKKKKPQLMLRLLNRMSWKNYFFFAYLW